MGTAGKREEEEGGGVMRGADYYKDVNGCHYVLMRIGMTAGDEKIVHRLVRSYVTVQYVQCNTQHEDITPHIALTVQS